MLPHTQTLAPSGDCLEHDLEALTLDSQQHGFLNISVTPIEVSIVCHSSWAKNVFEPFIKKLPKDVAKTVELSKHDYMILSVVGAGAGLDAAGRVMELTSPLALAGIPIFFISTYYSDFILVPAKERDNVVKALDAKGFELSENQSQFVNASAYGGRTRTTSAGTSSPPRTPPPSNLAELQTRAFDMLKKRNVAPRVEDDLELVQCSGREMSSMTDDVYSTRPSSSRHGSVQRRTWVDKIDTKLYTCVIAALVSQPRFMSITLTHEDPPSLLLDKTLLGLFGDSLVGDTDARHIPIFLDLVSLPLEVTGIVCGVAGKLVEDMQMAESSELSYLSTARAGAVILPEAQYKRALDILKPLLSKED